MRKTWLLISAIAIVAIAIIIVNQNGKKQNVIVRIGYLTITANLPLFVALEKGYFQEAGLTVEPVRFETSNQMVEALVADRIDIETGASSSVTVTVALTLQDKFRVFMLNAFTPKDFLSALLVRKDNAATSITSLADKKIGTFPGSTMKIYTSLLFEKAGVKPSEIIQLTPPTQLAALGSGSVEALVTLEPLGTIGERTGVAKRLEAGPIETHILNPWVAGTNSVSMEFLRDHRNETIKAIRALYKAVDFIREYPFEAKIFMTKYTPVNDPQLASILTIPNYWKQREMNVDEFQKMADNLYENGVIEKKINVSALLIEDLQ